MTLFEITSEHLQPLQSITYAASGLYERGDLQRLLKANIGAVLSDVLVISEEFGDWEGSSRRIDLLALDKDANLVVVELKRTEDGGHMELQALRYAAMVSTMTFDNVVDTYERFLRAEGRNPDDARSEILAFIGRDDPGIDTFGSDVRIVLVSSNFSKELTTAVMWLNRHLDITCIRMVPYQHEGRTFVDIQQIIPLPEAAEYQVRVKNKEHSVRQHLLDPANLKGAKALQLRFWTYLRDFANSQKTAVSMTKPPPQNWMGFSIGRSGFRLIAIASTWDSESASYDSNELRVELEISRDRDGAVLQRFLDQKESIERELGYPIYWENAPEKISRKAWVKRSANLNDESDWPNQVAWILSRLEDFHRVFGERIRDL